jgi:hypothetical protein
LNHVEVVLAGLSLGHDFRQQPFADGAKHGRLDKWVLGFKRIVEFLRLIDGHGSIDNQLALFLGALDKAVVIVGAQNGCWKSAKGHRDQQRESGDGHR